MTLLFKDKSYKMTLFSPFLWFQHLDILNLIKTENIYNSMLLQVLELLFLEVFDGQAAVQFLWAQPPLCWFAYLVLNVSLRI